MINNLNAAELFKQTLESLDEVVFIIDPSTRTIIISNNSVETIFGYKKEEVIGRTTEFLHVNSEMFIKFGKELFPALDRYGFYKTLFQMKRKNGEIFHIENWVTEIKDQSGKRKNVVSVIRDITAQINEHNALLESEERFKQLFYATQSVNLLIDPETGKIVDVSNAACNFYGYTKERLTSMLILDINTLSPEEIKTEMQNAAILKKNYFNFKHRVASGEVRDVEVYSSPVIIKGKKLLYSIIHDITERKIIERTLKESEKKHKDIISSTNEGYWELNEKSETVDVNSAMCEMLGFSKEEMVGKSYIVFVDEENANILISQLTRRETTKSRKYELSLKRKDGSLVSVIINATTLKDADGKITGSFAFVTDISEQKKITEELYKAKEEAEKAIKIKDKFVSIVAHDLRSPIVTIGGSLKLLKTGALTETDENGLLDAAYKSTQKMDALIKDYLSIGRIKTGNIVIYLSIENPFLLVNEVLSILSPAASEKGISIINKILPDTKIILDKSLTSQVLQNLISNAIKFSKNGDKITIFIPENRPNCIAVMDTGIGIKMDIQKSIFSYHEKKFGVGTSGEIGTGLGLPLSMDLMKAQGGNLWFESEEGKGSIFYAELPLRD